MKFKEIDKIAGTSKVPAIWSFKKREWKFIILFFLLFNVQNAFSQNISSNIRGIIKDAISQEELVGATLQLVDNEKNSGIVSDEKGEFLFENVVIGRYEMKVSYIGYETKKITEILVESGKETVLEIQLSESENELNEVVVKANSNENISQNYLSHHVITVEETERFPATFYDPARLAAAYPGIVNTNDQANNISIRGNSPANMKWYLEGVEIVNPNHLTTAGMFGDQISLGGGGVNILSAQMLNTSTILKGAYPANYGNAVGGIMDMRLRAGNNKNYEFTGQAGLLGFDFSAEGPFSKKSDASFLVNYRYSFTGLLAEFGVDFGGETIAFQDLSMTLNLPTKKFGNFKFFGIWGDSQNDFSGIIDPNLRIEDKERFDINYDADVWITGLSHQVKLGVKSSWNTTFVYSKSYNETVKNNLDDTDLGDAFDVNEEEKLSVNSFLKYKINAKHQFKIGAGVRLWEYDVLSGVIANIPDFSGIYVAGKKSSFLFNAYLNYKAKFAKFLDFEGSIRYTYLDIYEEHIAEPRFSLIANLNKNQQVSFTWGLNTQSHNSYIYSFADENLPGGIFNELIVTGAANATIGYSKIFENLIFSVEGYYQWLGLVPVILADGYESSIANLSGSIQEIGEIFDSGENQNYGIELSIEKPFKNGTFLLLNGTFYESKFREIDPRDFKDTRWNGKYAFNASFGKEFKKEKEERTRIFGLNIHAVYAGGMRFKNVDEAASQDAGITIFEKTTTFDNQFSNYFRPDLRLYLKWNKAKFNSMLSLDIQNVISRENDGFLIYDFVKNEAVLQKQLGMIPVLNYRIEF